MSDLVLLTGISGFIAKHVALKLLGAGYAVRGTLRRLDRADEVRAALAPHLPEGALDRLTFAACDLEADQGWDTAMAGVAAVVHTASPFPITQPKDAADLIRPAVEGTLRVLRAAQTAGVARVVLTSSTEAIMNPLKTGLHDESDWTDPAAADSSPYRQSKVLAERAAWDFVAGPGAGMALTVINPGFVMGPPLDGNYGSSVGVIARILQGRDPMMPDLGFNCVDVRDVAEMHLRALQRPETAGRRYLAVAGSMTMVGMARALKAAFPARRIPTMQAPWPLLWLLGRFDPQIRSILPMIGRREEASNARARAEMGMQFIPLDQAVVAAGEWLIAHQSL